MSAVNPLVSLLSAGQSFWLDNIRREWLESDVLTDMVKQRGLRGLTSNPAIFHKAITTSSAYDDQIRALAKAGANALTIYESLVIRDIRAAADVLRPVYDASDAADGYVSLEVSPLLAHDTEGTIAEGKRLFAAVERPNVMIKVPGTDAGIPAIEALISDGIPINVTLLFSVEEYEAAASAYIRGIRSRVQRGMDPKVASVASVFLSRIDSRVDSLLGQRIVAKSDASALLGKVAIAGAKNTYQRFLTLFAEDFADLRAKGAMVQRPLWASTSTKNVLYHDVMYIETLIGPDTVNTIPDATADAFEHHGEVVHDTISSDLDEVASILTRLDGLGISLKEVCRQLQDEGVEKFVKPFGQLIHALEVKRIEYTQTLRAKSHIHAGNDEGTVKKLWAALDERRFAASLWREDGSAFTSDPETKSTVENRLGWLTLPMDEGQLVEMEKLVSELGAFDRVLVIGMGGSSLAASAIGNYTQAPITVLDSTHPEHVARLFDGITPQQTVVVVASKSGTTRETLALAAHAIEVFSAALPDAYGRQFVAITDGPGPLVELAQAHEFAKVFESPGRVGGRFSALSYFGLLPAALAGVDIRALIAGAREAAFACQPELPSANHIGAQLGALLTLRPTTSLVACDKTLGLADWAEQLIAESTGKVAPDGSLKGVLPIVVGPEESVATQDSVHIGFKFDPAYAASKSPSLCPKTSPHAKFRLGNLEQLGFSFFIWEWAVAYAGALLGVNPFDEPNVASAKLATSEVLNGEREADAEPASAGAMIEWVERARVAKYVSVIVYGPADQDARASVARVRADLNARLGVPVVIHFAPRVLHSVGQLFKGGPKGVYVQVVDDGLAESTSELGRLLMAQAEGDWLAMRDANRDLIRVAKLSNIQDAI